MQSGADGDSLPGELFGGALRRDVPYAQIGETALIVGVGSKAEIWDAQRYADYTKAVESDVAELIEELDFE